MIMEPAPTDRFAVRTDKSAEVRPVAQSNQKYRACRITHTNEDSSDSIRESSNVMQT